MAIRILRLQVEFSVSFPGLKTVYSICEVQCEILNPQDTWNWVGWRYKKILWGHLVPVHASDIEGVYEFGSSPCRRHTHTHINRHSASNTHFISFLSFIIIYSCVIIVEYHQYTYWLIIISGICCKRLIRADVPEDQRWQYIGLPAATDFTFSRQAWLTSHLAADVCHALRDPRAP